MIRLRIVPRSRGTWCYLQCHKRCPFLLSLPPREKQSERRAQQQCAQQLLLIPDRDEASPLRTDLENPHGKSADTASAPAAFAARRLDLETATACPAAKTIGDFGHRNNRFVTRDDRFSEHALDLGAGGKTRVQGLQQSQTAHE